MKMLLFAGYRISFTKNDIYQHPRYRSRTAHTSSCIKTN